MILEPLAHPHLAADLLSQSFPRDIFTPERLALQVTLDPNFEPEGSILARDHGGLQGYALAIARKVPLENAPFDDARGYIPLLAVRPSQRGRGIGSALLDQAEAFLSAAGRKEVWFSPYAPGYFFPGIDLETNQSGLLFLTYRGYREAYRPLAMQISLWDFEVPSWTNDLDSSVGAVRIFPPSLDDFHPLLEFVRKHFPGDWVRVVRDAMREITLGGKNRLIIAASDVDYRTRVIHGFSHFDGERFGPIGVDEAERGRRIGQALMYATLRTQRDAGHRIAWFLWSDDRTAARLYTGAGFKEVRRFAVLKKDL